MAIIVRSVTNEAPTAAGVVNVVSSSITGFTNGGIMLGLNVLWVGQEFVDPATVGTLSQAYKPGDIGFNVYRNGQVTESLFSISYNAIKPTILKYQSRHGYRHPQYDYIKSCAYLQKMRPPASAIETIQGLIGAGDTVTCASWADDIPYAAIASDPGLHRCQFDIEFLVFE